MAPLDCSCTGKIVGKSAAQVTGLINEACKRAGIAGNVSIKSVLKDNAKIFGKTNSVTEKGAEMLKDAYGLKRGKDSCEHLFGELVKTFKKCPDGIHSWII